MARTKMRSQPSPYPILPFHALRACSLVCSLVVAAVLSYFVYHLKQDNFKIPWTFLVVSLLSSCKQAPSNIILALRGRTAFAPQLVSDISPTSFPCTLTTLQPGLQYLPSASMGRWPIIAGMEHVRHIESCLQHCELGFGSWNHDLPTL